MKYRYGGAALLLALTLTACSGSDDDKPDAKPKATIGTEGAPDKETDGVFHGVYVGKAKGTAILVAVVATDPAVEKERTVSVFACNGVDLVEVFAPATSKNDVEARSLDKDASVEATLAADKATGTVRLTGGRELQFDAVRTAGASGLYELELSPAGEVVGATEAGVGATGKIALTDSGKGRIALADGQSIEVAASAIRPPAGVEKNTARMIVSPDGLACGAAVRGNVAVGLRSS